MHRLIARFLMVQLLVGVLAPAALAMSGEPPHACCMRKGMAKQGSHEFRQVICFNHECCRPYTVPQAARLERAPLPASLPAGPVLSASYPIIHPKQDLIAPFSVRGPPQALRS
jgi:hypothetical protein